MSWGDIAPGLVLGGLAAFDALGLVLLYRTTRIVNLAQSSMGLIGGVLTGMLVQSAQWSFWWAAPIGITLGALVGLGTDRILLRRLREVPRAVVLVATVGVAQILGGISVAIPLIFGGTLPTYSLDFGPSFIREALGVTGPELLVLVAVPIAWYGTHHFLHRSRFGLAALALGQEAERARALGVPAAAVRGVVWVVAGILASFSGILSIPALGFNLGGGFSATILLLALAPAVISGFRNVNVAVISALVLGIVYRFGQNLFDRSSDADILLAVAIVVAFAVRRRELGRGEAASRASSWQSAATPRPLPRRILELPAVQMAGGIAFVIAAALAIVIPAFLSPSQDIAYAQLAAYAIAALGVAVGWMFAGEISLGHWGFAVYGAVIAVNVPGPWPLRCAIAAVAMGLVGIALALGTRGRSTLAFAALSLSAAATAPVAAVRVAGKIIETDLGSVAAASALTALILAAGIARLRRTRLGGAMIAARDEPQRAPWLGADPAKGRMVALFISMALAGLAGGIYVSGSGVGLPQRSADAIVSFDLLAMTVIGGLGSAMGALVGAAAIVIGSNILPGVWASFLSGAGILFVVIAAPAGLSRVMIGIRDGVVRVLAPSRPAPPVPKEKVSA